MRTGSNTLGSIISPPDWNQRKNTSRKWRCKNLCGLLHRECEQPILQTHCSYTAGAGAMEIDRSESSLSPQLRAPRRCPLGLSFLICKAEPFELENSQCLFLPRQKWLGKLKMYTEGRSTFLSSLWPRRSVFRHVFILPEDYLEDALGTFLGLYLERHRSQTQSVFNMLKMVWALGGLSPKTSHLKVTYPELQMSGTLSVHLFSLVSYAEL